MIFYFILCIIGLIIGSFLNVVICRTHKQQSIIFGRSCCPECSHRLSWYELVPVVSFLLSKGACRHCESPISRQYLLVELATAFLFIAVTYYASSVALVMLGDWQAILLWLRNLFVVSVFIVVFVYDLRWQLIPDRFTVPAIVLVFLVNLLVGIPVISTVIAMAVGGGFFLLQFIVSKGRWIGGGDIRLGVLIGAIVGWPVVVVALFFAYIIGAIILAPLLIAGRARLGMLVPFGTFLIIGALTALMWGEAIAGWYLGLL